MRQELDEFVEGSLEIDIVLPKRIVGVHDQVLGIHLAVRGARRKGISKMASTSMGTPWRVAGSNSHFASASAALRSRRSSRWRMSATESIDPFFRITAKSRTTPSTRSLTAAAMYLGSTLRVGAGGRTITPAAGVARSRSANQTSQLP